MISARLRAPAEFRTKIVSALRRLQPCRIPSGHCSAARTSNTATH